MSFLGCALVFALAPVAGAARLRTNTSRTRQATILCEPSRVELGCQRLGGGRAVVSGSDLLSTLSSIEYALRGAVDGGFSPADVVDTHFPLLGLKGARVLTHYEEDPPESEVESDHEEVLEDGAYQADSEEEDASSSESYSFLQQGDELKPNENLVDADSLGDPVDGEEVHEVDPEVVSFAKYDATPVAPLLRGLRQLDESWITVGFPSLAQTSGKFYYELKLLSVESPQVGFAALDFATLQNKPSEVQDLILMDDGIGVGDDTESWAVDGQGGYKYVDGEQSEWEQSWDPDAEVVVGCALDLDAKTVRFSTNGVWSGPLGTSDPRPIQGINAMSGIYPAASLMGKAVFHFADFDFAPPPGFLPWPAPSPAYNSWDFQAQVFDARLSVQERVDAKSRKSTEVECATVVDVLGSHVVVKFDDGILQEVPLEWLVARLEPGTPVIVYVSVSHSWSEPTLAVVETAKEGESPVVRPANSQTSIVVSPEDVLTEVSFSETTHGLAWQVETGRGAGRVVGLSADSDELLVVLPNKKLPLEVPFSLVHGNGPDPSGHSCQMLCDVLLNSLEGDATAIEDVDLHARVPKDPWPHREQRADLGEVIPLAQRAAERSARRAIHRSSSSLLQQDDVHLAKSSMGRDSRFHRASVGAGDMAEQIGKARWALAGYFGALPSSTAVDMATLPEWIGNTSRSQAVEQMQQEALMARVWVLNAMGEISDRRAGRLTPQADPEDMMFAIETMLGDSSQTTLSIAFDVLEGIYVSLVNMVFRYEPIQKVSVPWSEEPVYPSALYHGRDCTDEDECLEGCSPDTFAYVFPSGSWSQDIAGRRIMNFCPLFFQQGGSDLSAMWQNLTHWQGTRVGTLIHEASHHSPSLTSDVKDPACVRNISEPEDNDCYGFEACANLAKENPRKALENADNFLYLTELLMHGNDADAMDGANRVYHPTP